MPARHARLYDALALLTVIIVVAIDQWTKNLVVSKLTVDSEVPFPLVGHFLVLERTVNSGAAFSMFQGSFALIILIVVAICVVIYLYSRIINTGSLIYKIVFGMIIGGAMGNLLDRALRNGVVVDFISFRIPDINFYFAIFNVADACISVGVIALFLLVVMGKNSSVAEVERADTSHQEATTSNIQSGNHQDAQ